MRRRAALAVIGAALLWACLSPASGPPDAPATPEGHVRLAVSHLRSVPTEDRHYARYVSWLAVPRGRLPVAQAVMRWWLNQLSTEQAVARPALVSGSQGLLWQLDLRDYNWNARAWRVVARREPYFREPWVSREAARLLRLRIGEEPRPDDDGTAHVIGVVRADWLFRETIESARSDSYYDLLYAGKRFPDGKGAVDFPADEKDWNDFFGELFFGAFPYTVRCRPAWRSKPSTSRRPRARPTSSRRSRRSPSARSGSTRGSSWRASPTAARRRS